MARIAIIGTAGRKADGNKLNKELYGKMFHAAQKIIGGWNLTDITLVSGGAAWADHIAVSLYLAKFMNCKLELHLPCPFDVQNTRFYDTGVVDFRTNPGGTANYYHRQFSQKMGGSTLTSMARILPDIRVFDNYKGLFDRNNGVARVDYMIAFTFGYGQIPKDGGTKNTWNLSKRSTKFHQSLYTI